MTATDRQLALARSQGYWLLSRVLLERPEAGLLGDLAQGWAQAGETDLAALGQAAREVLEQGTLEPLAVEYTRILRGIREGYGPPPPYESVYREGRLVGEATVRVQRAYAEAGFGDVAPEAGPQDHLGAELRFLALLCHQEAEAWEKADPEGATKVRERQRTFLDQHLLVWLPDYEKRLRKEAHAPFYRALSDVLARRVADDRALLDELTAAA